MHTVLRGMALLRFIGFQLVRWTENVGFIYGSVVAHVSFAIERHEYPCDNTQSSCFIFTNPHESMQTKGDHQ